MKNGMKVLFSKTFLLCIITFLTVISIYTDIKVFNVSQALYKSQQVSVVVPTTEKERLLSPVETQGAEGTTIKLNATTTTTTKTETLVSNETMEMTNVGGKEESDNRTVSSSSSSSTTTLRGATTASPVSTSKDTTRSNQSELVNQDKSSISSSSSTITTAATTTNNNSNNDTAMVIDIVVTGSKTKSEFYETQRKTFGQHVVVRNFFVVTEDDDFETNCSTSLTNDDVKNIQRYCSDYRRTAARKGQKLLAGLMDLSMPDDILSMKTNAAGWICAQKRPLAGFVKAMKYYTTTEHPSESFPDFLIMLDDDSYINMDLVVEHLKDYNPSKDSKAVAGCMMPVRVYHRREYVSNFDIPFGGFGTAFSRRMLNNFSRSLNCAKSHLRPFERHACKQLQNSIMGESSVFQNGMTMTDVMYQFATEDLFTNYTHWTTANSCFHSDWYWGYFMNWYSHPAKQLFHLRRGKLGNEYFVGGYSQKFGVVPYQNSQYDFKEKPVTKTGQCYNDNTVNCTISSHFCHYVSPDTMVNITNQLKQVHPHRFKQQGIPTVVGETVAAMDY